MRVRHTATAAVCAALALVAAVPAAAAPTWLLPPTVLSATATATTHAAVSPSGDAVAVFEKTVEGKNVVFARTRPAGGAWAEAVPISDASVTSGDSEVTIDAAGNATAVWRSFFIKATVVASFRPAGGDWGLPTSISDTDFNAIAAPQVAADAAGTVTVVWTTSDGSTTRVTTASRPLSGVWTGPVDRSDPSASNPRIAAGPVGSTTAVWVRSDVSGSVVEASTMDAAGQWSSPVPLSASSPLIEPPRIAVDQAGHAIAVWPRYQDPIIQVEYSDRAPGGGWSPAQVLSTPGLQGRFPEVDADQGAGVVVAWSQLEDGKYRAKVSRRPVGGAFEPAATLSEAGQDGLVWGVGMDPSGDQAVTFTRSNGTVPVVYGSHRAGSGLWSQPEPLTPGAVESAATGLEMDDAGNALIPLLVAGVPFSSQVVVLDAASPTLTAFKAPAKGVAKRSASFSAAAFDTWSSVASYAWSFGDGTKAAGPAVKHAYNKSGKYTVALTVTDAVGNATTQQATIKIRARPVIKVFRLASGTIRVGGRTTLTVKLNTKATLKLVIKGKSHGVTAKLKKKLPKGTSRLTIRTTVGGKHLVPDTYVLSATATDSTGTSKKKQTKLVVTRG